MPNIFTSFKKYLSFHINKQWAKKIMKFASYGFFSSIAGAIYLNFDIKAINASNKNYSFKSFQTAIVLIFNLQTSTFCFKVGYKFHKFFLNK